MEAPSHPPHPLSLRSSYEIHLCPEVRRKGLGKFLIQILELIGHRQVIVVVYTAREKLSV